MPEEVEVTEVVEEVVDNDPLEDIFPDRHPLVDKGADLPVETETLSATEEPKGDELTETPAEPVKKEEVKAEVDPMANEIAGLKAAAKAERVKRQELERQLQAANQEPQKPTEFNWDNPEQTIASVEQRVEQKMQTNLLNMSEAQARSRYEDYDQKYEVFVKMTHENPAIINAMLQQPDPAEYAYRQAERHLFTEEVGANPQDYKAKLEAELRLKIEDEFKQKQNNRQAISDSLPPSAANMTSKNQPVDVVDDDPLGSLFNDTPS